MARLYRYLIVFNWFQALLCRKVENLNTVQRSWSTTLASTFLLPRGGATSSYTSNRDESYFLLARAIQDSILEEGPPPEIPKLVKALKALSGIQKTFKGLDGAAHEAYQRTHHDSNNILDVKGRAQRSAARLAATAESLGACELLELTMDPTVSNNHHGANGTLVNRHVLLNTTIPEALGTGSGGELKMLVLYESAHGESTDTATTDRKGRLVVVLTDSVDIGDSLKLLDDQPRVVMLGKGPEAASVQPTLHSAASTILRSHLEAILRSYPKAPVHISGFSLSGGVAAIAGAILQGELPLHAERPRRSKRSKQKRKAPSTETNDGNTEPPLQGLCKKRISVLSLGGPPCFSANVGASFVTSMMYGDDIICRTSPDSIERFFDRTRRALKNSGFLGKRLNWMTDTVSLAATNLRSHAVGSDGEEARLTIPGIAFLVRPRRLGGLCSIHEIGQQLKNRREALRASMLWQLNDILLSHSFWRHHQLESYIKGLDRVQLRGLDDHDD